MGQKMTLLPRSFFSVVKLLLYIFSQKSKNWAGNEFKVQGMGKPEEKSGRLIWHCGVQVGGLEGEETIWIIPD